MVRERSTRRDGMSGGLWVTSYRRPSPTVPYPSSPPSGGGPKGPGLRPVRTGEERMVSVASDKGTREAATDRHSRWSFLSVSFSLPIHLLGVRSLRPEGRRSRGTVTRGDGGRVETEGRGFLPATAPSLPTVLRLFLSFHSFLNRRRRPLGGFVTHFGRSEPHPCGASRVE